MRKGAHTLWECQYHIGWCPKYRKKIFEDEGLRGYAWKLFEEIGAEYEVEIEAMEIAVDHVHLLVVIPPKLSVAEVVRVFKSISAREIFKRFPGVKKKLWAGELWKDGYFVKSVGSGVTKENVRDYIETHKEREGSPAQLRLDLRGEPKRAKDTPRLAAG